MQQQQIKQQQSQLKNNFNQSSNANFSQQSNFPSFQSKPVTDPNITMQAAKVTNLSQYSNNPSNNLPLMPNMPTLSNQGFFPSASMRQFPPTGSHLIRNISSYENFDPSKSIPMTGLTRNALSASNNLYKVNEQNSFQNERLSGFSSINPMLDSNQQKHLHGMNFSAAKNESNNSTGLIKQLPQPQNVQQNNLSSPFFQSFNQQQSRGY